MHSEFIISNNIKLHFLTHPGNKPTVILMHGLTANASCFNGLIAAGLSPAVNVLSVDLRGRGLSDHPASGYGMPEHAKDILGLLDVLGIQKAIIGGHSFGALLSFYLATHHPDRVEKIIIIDAAAQMHPETKKMLGPALSRLGQTFPSFQAYITQVKQAPYLNIWDDQMESYYRADVKDNSDGTVTPRSDLAHITEAVTKVLEEPWLDYLTTIKQPAILINGTGEYTMGAALLPKENALATVKLMHDCRYVEVEGNHQTMLYGKGAAQIVKAIISFLKEGEVKEQTTLTAQHHE